MTRMILGRFWVRSFWNLPSPKWKTKEYEDSVKLIGSLWGYFKEVDNEEEEASLAISLPKRSRKPNGFNAILSENGFCTYLIA